MQPHEVVSQRCRPPPPGAAGPRSGIGSLGQVAERIDRIAVQAHLEVQVRARAEAGAADVADRLALGDLLVTARRRCGTGGRTGSPGRCGGRSSRGCRSRTSSRTRRPCRSRPRGSGCRRDADVDARMQGAPAHAERARDRPRQRPREAAARRRLRRRAARRDAPACVEPARSFAASWASPTRAPSTPGSRPRPACA